MVFASRFTIARAAAGLPLLAGLLVLPSCVRFDPARPDVVLILVDTLRADHLGVYGYRRPTSPRIDRLAAGGAVFDQAWAAAPWTLPSTMSIFTGRFPSAHRVESQDIHLPHEIPTLTESLHARGWRTGGFASHVYTSRLYGFDRGFQTYDDFGMSSPDYVHEKGLEPDAERVTGAALDWLRRQGKEPVFLFVHYFDPHWPYAAPGGDRDVFPSAYAGPLEADYDALSKFIDTSIPIPDGYLEFLVNRYDGEILHTDRQIGRLLDGFAAAGRAGRTWVLLTADHGEEFRDHGSMGHGRRLYEEIIRVPLIVSRVATGKVPDAGPARVAVPVSGIDLLPTILDLADAGEPPAGASGRSLVPLLPGSLRALVPDAIPGTAAAAGDAVTGRRAGPDPFRPLVSETSRLNAFRKAVREGPMKLIRSMDDNSWELYDLAADPLERHELAEARPDDTRRLAQTMFATVDFLSGGWNLRWNGDGRRHRFEGVVRTKGSFRTVVPLFQERGRYRLEHSDTLFFVDDGQEGESGLMFTTAPYEAPVEFRLSVDGRPSPERIFLGGRRVQPPHVPFTLGGDPDSEAAYERPAHQPGRDLGFYLWRIPLAPRDEVVLDEEIRARLKSLGYID